MRSHVHVAWLDPERDSGQKTTEVQTHSRLGHSAMYVREEKAAPLPVQSC